MTMVERRSTGVMTIFPGSVHERGEPIEWADDGEPTVVDPQVLLAEVNALAHEVERQLGYRCDEDREDDCHLPDTSGWKTETCEAEGLKPGADFNARGDVREVLRR